MVRKSEKPSHFQEMLWLTWDLGHPPFKFVFCHCKGSPTLFSYVKHDWRFISGEKFFISD